MHFKYILFAITLSLMPLQSYGLTLYEALSIAYKNNPRIRSERESLKSIDEATPQALSQFLPTLNAEYSKSKFKDKSDFATNSDTSHPTNKSLTFAQPIFDGGRSYFAVKQAKSRIMSARARLQQVEQQLLSQAIIAFVDVIRTREVFELSKNNEKVLKEQLNATLERFELGETTKTDVAQAEARLARAESDRIDAFGNTIAEASDYKRIFEVEPPAEMEVPKKLPEIPNSLEEALDIALKYNPALVRAMYDTKVAKDNVAIAKSALLPSVNIQGIISRDSGLRSRSGGGDLDTESVTLNVRVPLFQSGIEYSRIRENKHRAQSALLQLDDTKNATIDNTTESWKDIETSRANIKANQASVQATTLALDGVKEEREIGSRTTLDVLDAEQEFFTAQVNLATAKRNEVVAVFNLKAAMGELTAQGINLPVDIYDPEINRKKTRFKLIGF